MKLFKNSIHIGIFCTALFVGPTIALASDGDDFEAQYLRERVSELVMPETCASPYREAPEFMQFFHATLLVMAAEKSYDAGPLSDLFAVMALREKMRNMFPNLGEESPLDRLVIAQLCNYEIIEKSKHSQPAVRIVIPPTNAELHSHLIQLAPRLYQDSRKLMVEALASMAKERKKLVDLERQWNRVQKMKALGEDKIRNLFDETSF